MYKVELTGCYMNTVWVFEDFDTAALFVKMALIGNKDQTATITKEQEEKQDESL
ncbi:MAG: hypothetical protein IKW21_05425 [Lachnospiraceae bacterium]|nr:hypothetical protein [Lachnospiraceae bacterium]